MMAKPEFRDILDIAEWLPANLAFALVHTWAAAGFVSKDDDPRTWREHLDYAMYYIERENTRLAECGGDAVAAIVPARVRDKAEALFSACTLEAGRAALGCVVVSAWGYPRRLALNLALQGLANMGAALDRASRFTGGPGAPDCKCPTCSAPRGKGLL